jgi:hypothetical protein
VLDAWRGAAIVAKIDAKIASRYKMENIVAEVNSKSGVISEEVCGARRIGSSAQQLWD